ncbi:MAG: flagellar biosynthesis protein FlhA [bacterium]
MASINQNPILKGINENSDILFAFAIVGVVIMFIIPLPTMLMDILLAANITFSLTIILVSVYITEPLEISVLPALLLFATLFRLGLNVSTTRLILGEGYAGKVITSFGNFVVGGNPVVGFIIFLILVVIQFIVITKGAERVAEVAARFTLDAMPGKQMSIDADLNAGVITDEQAKEQRMKIRQEADFYGAMDGSSKFVKGDAIAGIIITVINIIGGLIIGVAQQGMSFADAAQNYTLLTVGDGLVSQIPALLISTATGLVVTRAVSDNNMGKDVSQQLTSQPKALWIASAVLFLLGLIPGLPFLPFMILSLMIGSLGFLINNQQEQDARELANQESSQEIIPQEERITDLLKVDPLEMEVGYNLISLVLPEQGGDFLDRVAMIRRQLASELGIIVPSVRIVDNLQLDPNFYSIKLQGVEIASYEMLPDHLLAMDSGITTEKIEGIETKEPAFNMAAMWITEDQKEKAEMANYTVVDPSSAMATHLSEVIKSHAYELLGRQQVQELIDNIKEDHSAVINELLPDLLSLGQVQKVLQNLLWEGIPIKNLVLILETLADYAPQTNSVQMLTEYVRQALARQITNCFTEEDGKIYAITIDPMLEEKLNNCLEQTEQDNFLNMSPQEAQDLLEKIAQHLQTTLQQGIKPILLTTPILRRPLKGLIYNSLQQLTVLSYNELKSNINLQVVGNVN